MTHTPGPWHVDPRASLRVANADDVTVATCGCDSSINDEWEANARLIAAAPLLLEALEEVWPYFEGEHYIDHPSCKLIRAALAVAKGE